MSVYKEIVTKAVIGKGKKYVKDNYKIDVENSYSNIVLDDQEFYGNYINIKKDVYRVTINLSVFGFKTSLL